MAVWHSIFLQEFPDRNLRNFHSVQGRLITSAQPPDVSADAAEGWVALIFPERWYRFQPEAAFDGVVGVDIALRVHIPRTSIQNFTDPIVLVSIGDQLQLSAQFRLPLEVSEPVAMASLRFRTAGSALEWSSFPINQRRYAHLRVNWYTSGQAQIWHDRELVAFANHVAPRAKLKTSDIVIGDPSLSAAPGVISHFRLGYLYVRLVREHDAFTELGKNLPLDLPDDPRLQQCIQQIRGQQLAILDRVRAFMSRLSQKTTTNWQAGDPGGPFSTAAVDAQKLGKDALRAFILFLETLEQARADEALDRFTKFFGVLRLHAPDDMKAMVAEIAAVPEVSEECRAVAERILTLNEPRLGPVQRLMQGIANLVTAGG
jgi:hypothetical protein